LANANTLIDRLKTRIVFGLLLMVVMDLGFYDMSNMMSGGIKPYLVILPLTLLWWQLAEQ